MFFQDYLKIQFNEIMNFLISNGEVGDFEFKKQSFGIEIPQKSGFGDISSNIAMVLAKTFKTSPIKLAKLIQNELIKKNFIKKVEVVNPGFINIFFYKEFWHNQLSLILKNGLKFNYNVKKQKVCIEFVSANPTGLMHIGHARGAVLGDSISSLLEEVGYETLREYYINDAGEQIKKLIKTIDFHLINNHKKNVEFPEDLYPGEYLRTLSSSFANNKKVKKNKIIDMVMSDIKKDLNELKVKHTNFVSEENNLKPIKIESLKSKLLKDDLAYYGFQEKPKISTSDWKPEQQFLFRSKKFGDDSDRALLKPNNELTYFMSDIIYHNEKLERNFDILINIWGADHTGYVMRLKNALQSINPKKKYFFEIKLTALVNLMENNRPIKMSKRAGSYITLREVLKKVGTDPIRFMMISRSPDKKIDFDLKTVLEKTKDNPVFYIQYAYARCKSILRISDNLFKKKIDFSNCNISYLELKEEKSLIIHLCNFKNIIFNSAINYEPHKLANYLYDLSKMFHNYWGLGNMDNKKKIINEKKIEISISRLALVFSVSLILKKGLDLLKINCPDSM